VEEKMIWYSIIIFTAMGMPMIQIDDKRGPYVDLNECYTRGAIIIKDITSSGRFPPIISAQAFCIDTERSRKPSVEKQKNQEEIKPKPGSSI
jgi:hypothetical protein